MFRKKKENEHDEDGHNLFPKEHKEPVDFIGLWFAAAAVVLLVLMVAVVFCNWQRSVAVEEKQTVSRDLEILRKEFNALEKEIGAKKEAEDEGEEIQATVTIEDSFKIYMSDASSVSFKYPGSYSIISDEIVHEYGDGSRYFRLKIASPAATENPEMILDINPVGSSFAPDSVYQLSESIDGKLKIKEVVTVEKNSINQDGKVSISTNPLTSRNETIYQFVYTFEEGGEDLEQVFKNILATVKFY